MAVCFITTHTSMAATIVPTPEADGVVRYDGFVSTGDEYLNVWNGTDRGMIGVVEFDLSAIEVPVTAASLLIDFRHVGSAGGGDLLVTHGTAGGDGALTAADYSVSLETVGIIPDIADNFYTEPRRLDYDITAMLNNDLAQGYSHSAFQLEIINHPGGGSCSIFFYSVEDGTYPAPRIEYVPEPATMSLMAVGGLALIRRRK